MRYIITLFIVVIAVCPILGQEQDERDVNLNQISSFGYGDYAESNTGNGVFIAQAGVRNSVDVKQYNRNNEANLVSILQGGLHQQINLTQNGSNNRANFRQALYKNKIDVTQRGNFISSDITQFGFGNSVTQELGMDDANYTVVQFGYGHSVNDTGFSPNNPGYTIMQTGMVGMTVTIEHH